MKVKGTMIVDYVRLIRAHKDIDWDKWLADEDWEIINSNLMASSWYPYLLFSRMGWAAYQEIAGGDPEMIRAFGRFNMQNLLKVYKNLLTPNDPVASVTKVARTWGNFFQGDGVESTIMDHGPQWITYKMKAPDKENDPDKIVAFAHQLSGQLIELVASANGQNPTAEVSSEGHSQYITVRWA